MSTNAQICFKAPKPTLCVTFLFSLISISVKGTIFRTLDAMCVMQHLQSKEISYHTVNVLNMKDLLLLIKNFLVLKFEGQVNGRQGYVMKPILCLFKNFFSDNLKQETLEFVFDASTMKIILMFSYKHLCTNYKKLLADIVQSHFFFL